MTQRVYRGVRHDAFMQGKKPLLAGKHDAPSALSFRASLSEHFHFRHVLQTSRDGSVAKPQSMLNLVIFDPWQRSLLSRHRTPRKEPLLAGK